MQLDEIKNRIGSINVKYFPIGIFLFAFLVRLFYIVEFKGTTFIDCLTFDSLYYSEWAKRIADGKFLPHDLFETAPLYAYLLALFYKIISFDLFFVRFAQIIIGSASVVLIYSLTATLLKSRYWGLLGGFIAAIYGPFIFFDGVTAPTFLAVFLVLLMLFFLLRLTEPSLWNALFSAIALALTMLVQESIIILVPIIPLWILLRKEMAEKLLKLIFFFAGLIIILLPVALMNYSASGELAISASGGENFYMGTNEKADGTYQAPELTRVGTINRHEAFRIMAKDLSGKHLSRKESSSFWYKKGFDFITSNPTSYTELTARKFLIFWNFYEPVQGQNYYSYRAISTVLSAPVFGFGFIAPFGFLGFCLAIRRLRQYGILFWVLFFYQISLLLVYHSAAFRLPVVPILIIFSVFSFSWFVEKAREKKYVYIGIALYVLVMLSIISSHEMFGETAKIITPQIC